MGWRGIPFCEPAVLGNDFRLMKCERSPYGGQRRERPLPVIAEAGPALPGARPDLVQDTDSIPPLPAGHGQTPAAKGHRRHQRKGY